MVTRTVILALLFALFGAIPIPAPVKGQAPPISWPLLSLERIPGNFRRPVHITHAGDGSGRIFVVEKRGVIRVVEGGQLRPTPFLDITDRVVDRNEAGLLSLAFPPDFAASGAFFVYYTPKKALSALTGPATRTGLPIWWSPASGSPPIHPWPTR